MTRIRRTSALWVLAALVLASSTCPAETAKGGVVHRERTEWTTYYWFGGPDVSKIYPKMQEFNKPLWGLEELAKRTGTPDVKLITEADGTRTPERTIFRDPAYGSEIWKLTHHTGSIHVYGDVSPWNANGEVMSIRARNEQFLVEAPGDVVRPLGLPDPIRVSHQPCWDRRDPHVFYTPVRWNPKLKDDEQPRGIWRVNFRTGEKTKLYDVTRVEFESPLSVDGEWMCFKVPDYSARAMQKELPDYSTDLNREANWGVGIARTDGSKLIWIRGGVHTIRVVGGTDYLFEVEQKFIDREGRVLDCGINKNTQGSHHSYNRKGTRVISHSASGFQIGDIQGTRVVNLRNLFTDYKRWVFGGHTSWLSDDDDWCFVSIGAGTFAGQLIKVRTDGSGTVHPIAFYNTQPTGGGDYWSSARAACSPDGTKFLFDARTFRKDVFSCVAVVKRPDPPQFVRVLDTAPGKVHIQWAPPCHHSEVQGYHVYRSTESGRGFVQITDEPVAKPEFVDETLRTPGQTAYYLVTSVEHSGLESSHFSNEVGVVVGQNEYPKDRPVRIFVEAEAAESTVYPPMREARDVSAAGEACMWHSPGEGNAWFYAHCRAPRLGDYHLWARVKSPKAGTLQVFALGEGEIRPMGYRRDESTARHFDVPDTKGEWVWVRTREHEPYQFVKAPPRQDRILKIESQCPGVKIDRFLWTTDKDFTPKGRGNSDETAPAPPTGLAAKFLAKDHVKVTWNAGRDKDLRYYNVYASTDGPPTAGQKHLLFSPSRTYVIDWGVPEGQTVQYAVTAVDRSGNESLPSRTTAAPQP
ncbi:MAG TPA: fibronectin type III domain-containing protein [Planctomycetota bacterium]|nr:fibronectin type III domain-containing protein [Planctomycetota bacterium]